MPPRISRRLLLGTTVATVPLPGLLRARGDTPEFEMKLGNDNPMSHPNTIRQQEAVERILNQTNGRDKISISPNNQLGGDTDMLSQLRSGALEFMTLSGLIFLPSRRSVRSTASATRGLITSTSGPRWTVISVH